MRAARTTPPLDEEAPVRLPIAPDVLSLFWVENIGVMVWHQPPSARVVESLHRSAEPRRKQYPTGMSFVHIGRVQLALLDAETRAVFVRIAKELSDYTAVTVFVAPQASSFWASTLRSVVTGVLVLARSAINVHFEDDAERVSSWLPARHAELTGIQVDVDRLRRVLLRAASLSTP